MSGQLWLDVLVKQSNFLWQKQIWLLPTSWFQTLDIRMPNIPLNSNPLIGKSMFIISLNRQYDRDNFRYQNDNVTHNFPGEWQIFSDNKASPRRISSEFCRLRPHKTPCGRIGLGGSRVHNLGRVWQICEMICWQLVLDPCRRPVTVSGQHVANGLILVAGIGKRKSTMYHNAGSRLHA